MLRLDQFHPIPLVKALLTLFALCFISVAAATPVEKKEDNGLRLTATLQVVI